MSKILYGKPVAENLDIQSKDIFKDYESKHDKLPRLTAITVAVSYTHLTLPTTMLV